MFLRAVSGFIRKKARIVYASKTLLTAGLCVVQRFGSALQLAPHFHAALFDGAYRKDADGKLHFVAAPAITPAERLSLTTRTFASHRSNRLHFDSRLVTFTMKRVFSGSQVLRFTPQAFIRRIAMLVLAPSQHEITYFGLLAANAKHRKVPLCARDWVRDIAA